MVRLYHVMLTVPLILAGQLLAVPPAPTQVSPQNGDTLQTLTPTLEVEYMSGVDMYNFRVIRNDSVIGTIYPESNYVTWPEDLAEGCTYQWICRARDASGWGNFCGRWSFFIQLPAPPPPPAPVAPPNGSQVDTTSPQLRVQAISGAVEYRFYVFYDGNLVRNQSMPVPYVYVNPPLPNGLDYQWTCAARNNVGWSQPFEPYWGFTVRSNGVEERATSREAQPSLVSCEVEPSPFSARTSVKYNVPLGGRVALRVLSPTGRLVRTLREGYVAAGTYTTTWNGLDDLGSPVSKGVYFCRLESGSQVSLRKLVRSE